nr:MAG TPA: Heat shock cognate 71 kDa-protein complex, ATP-binding, Chaperone, Nucleotide-binding [Caudoviricetes sp.]
MLIGCTLQPMHRPRFRLRALLFYILSKILLTDFYN